MPLFAVTVFLGAFLLFQVQPLIGKHILPMFGSAPGVWTTCLLFFQLLLLAGYAYAHLITRRLSSRAQATTHAALLGCAFLLLPVTLSGPGSTGAADDPVLQILLLLAGSVGLPYFLLSGTAPLMQSWFARSFSGRSPYRLYALSNLGSILALLTYPIVIEPHLGLGRQTVVWSVAFVAFALCCAWCARRSTKAQPVPEFEHEEGREAEPSSRPRMFAIGRWLALSACGSGLLMATTNQMCTDVAVVPFLWVLPLGIYLLTFVICFHSDRWHARPLFHALLPMALAAACLSLHTGLIMGIATQIAIGVGSLFVLLMCCHGELARLRPPVRHLTLFYLMIALGGAVGGLFVAVVAPLTFNGIWEYPLLLLACYILVLFAAVRPEPRGTGERPPPRFLRVGATVLRSLFVLFTVTITILYLNPSRWLMLKPVGRDALRLDNLIAASGIAALVILLVTLSICGVTMLRRGGDRSRRMRRASGRLLRGACLLGLVPLAGTLGWHVFGDRENLLRQARNFYGALRIEALGEGPMMLVLKHGRITHGMQDQADHLRGWPSTYYGPLSGLGLAIRRHPDRFDHRRSFRIGVVGLGAGTVAAYGNAVVLPNVGRPPYLVLDRRAPPDRFVFYEVNPLMVDWSKRYFRFLADAEARGAKVEIHLGDARIVMEQQLLRRKSQNFDVLAVDAFNGDAIPTHLLTNECFQTYVGHLATGGILAVHVSNRHLDLISVVHRLACHNGWASVHIANEDDEAHGVGHSDWVLVTRNDRFLESPDVAPLVKRPVDVGPLWTDDYSSILGIILSLR